MIALITVTISNHFFSYDDIWDGTSKKSGNDFAQKMEILTGGFERYMKEYFYPAKVKTPFDPMTRDVRTAGPWY